jgi:transporter family protein
MVKSLLDWDYRVWALLSAVFAGLTAVLAKRGVEGVPANLALFVRVLVILAFAAAIAVATRQANVGMLGRQAWLFLVLSGLATGLSWLCYFRALQLGPVSRVAPIDKLSYLVAMALGFVALREAASPKAVIGGLVIGVGVLITLF